MPQNVVKHLHTYIVLSLCLLLCFSNIVPLLAQEETPPVEPPTTEPPTIEPPTATFTDLPPPTATNTELLPPTATNTEIPRPTATFTETSLSMQPPTETTMTTLTETPSLTPTFTETATWTETPATTLTFTPSPTTTPSPTLAPALEPFLEMSPASGFAPLTQGCGAALVNAGDTAGLSAAFQAAWEGLVCTIYLNVDIDYNAPEVDRTYFVSNGFGIQNTVTIHGNNAIIRRTEGRVLWIGPNADVNIHHLTITGGDLTIVTNSDGYGAGGDVYGTLRLYDSAVVENIAQHGGGGFLNYGSNLTLRRVAIHANEASGGAGIQNDLNATLDAECVQFWNNSGGYGVGLLNGSIDNTASQVTIRYSSFDGNVAAAPDSGADIFNLVPNDVTIMAQQNWWGADGIPEVDDGGTGASIDTSQALTFDPTIPINGQYAISECEPEPPESPPLFCPAGGATQFNGITIVMEEDCPELSLQKTVDVPFPQEGDTVTLTVQVFNGGQGAATNISITDILPTGLTFVSATPSTGTYNAGVWTIPTLNPLQTATLAITVTVNTGTLGQTLINVAEITSFEPTPATFPEPEESIVIPALCAGVITSHPQGAANVRVDKRTVNGDGSPNTNFVGSPLAANTQVPVIGYDIHDLVNLGVAPAAHDDIEANYGWYRIVLPVDTVTPHREGWVVYQRVSGCSDLSRPLVFNPSETIGTDDNEEIPTPTLHSFNSSLRCAEGIDNPLAHLDCAAQVYYAFYTDATFSPAPVLGELLASIYLPEVGVAPDEIDDALLDGVYINNWRRSCAGECDGQGTLMWLASKQAWYNVGRASFSSVDVTQLVSDSQDPNNLAVFQGTLGSDYTVNGETPIDWGNWWYGVVTDGRIGYNQVLYTQSPEPSPYVPTLGCARLAGDGAGNWFDYVFAVVTAQQDESLPATNVKNASIVPLWVINSDPAPGPICPIDSAPQG